MLTNVSEHLIQNIISLIKKTNIKHIKSNSSTNKLVEQFINEIIEQQDFVEKNVNILKCKNISNVTPKTTFIKDYINSIELDYISIEIVDFIKKNNGLLIKYTFNLSKKYIIYFIVYEKDHTNYSPKKSLNKFTKKSTKKSTKKYDNYAKHILALILFLEKYRKIGCKTDVLEIFLYMTPFKKELPKKHEIIGPSSMNTGHTTPCLINSKIVIYRIEEFFKVTLHELIHSMGIEFGSTNTQKLIKNMREIFLINSTFLINETYTEFWAEFINIVYYILILYNNSLKQNKIKFTSKSTQITEFINLFDTLYFIEKVNTYIQCIKILDHMSLTYKDLISKNEKKNAFI